jgi:hypothetical protein
MNLKEIHCDVVDSAGLNWLRIMNYLCSIDVRECLDQLSNCRIFMDSAPKLCRGQIKTFHGLTSSASPSRCYATPSSILIAQSVS